MQLSYGSLNKIAGSKRCIKNVPLSVPLVNIGRFGTWSSSMLLA